MAPTGTPGPLPRTRRQDCFKISGFVGIAGIVEELGLLDRAQLQIENTKTAIYRFTEALFGYLKAKG